MVALSLLFLIFLVTVCIILIFPPGKIQHDEGYKVEVRDLWGIVKLCQTSNFGKPHLTLRPANRSVEMFLNFPDADKMILSLPLKLKKQQKAREEYLNLFAKHDLQVFESKDHLTVHLDRKNEELGPLVANLYHKIFEARNADIVNFKVKLTSPDLRALAPFKRPIFKLNPDYKFIARSARHNGRSVIQIQISRILNAVYWLLYPPMIILSYKFFGLNVMCWTALAFFGFFTLYRTVGEKKKISDSWGNILYCLLIFVTLITQDTNLLQSIPSVMGTIMATISATLALGILEPKSESDKLQKHQEPQKFMMTQILVVLGGIGLFLMNEWVRRHYGFESWVWFFGFFRFELIILLCIIFIPVYLFYLYRKQNTAND